ncbi:MAG TPA: hypothetical protein VGX28_15835 [Frankiaceae bacterium]|jgi:predicted kinase|nr:hypothetical protein [Frankiaceae bacterium]
MTLGAYQNALADLVASPDAVRAVRAGDHAVLDGYDLTPRERARLVTVAGSPRMATNCMLYRAHRTVPLARLLPRTVAALGERMRATVDAFWAATPDTLIQFEDEARAFAAFVAGREPDVAATVTEEIAALDTRYPRLEERAAF